MAHFYASNLERIDQFNFAEDVVDYWAAKKRPLQAMFWLSQDGSEKRFLDFEHFSRQSHRIAKLFDQLRLKRGDTILVVLPRIPEW
jgi:medium-chain acyl-CoA synthetase